MVDQPSSSRLMVLLFTDLVGSVNLKTRLGTRTYARLLARHDELFREVIDSIARAELLKDTGDGFLARFETASDALAAALCFQHAMACEAWDPEPLVVRMGLHLGQMTELELGVDGQPKLVGLAADIGSRLVDLARPAQILTTRAVFDDGRQYVKEHPRSAEGGELIELRWMAHGPYRFKGEDDPMDVFEVGAAGVAPLSAPPDSEKAKRAIAAGDEDVYGWRPAAGLSVPERENWVLERQLGEGGFGDVWLARHRRTHNQRVFKFCFDADHVRSLKRELTLFRLLSEALGDRPDIAKIYDIQLDQPPFFLESEFTEQGDLVDWSNARGDIDQLPLSCRLDLMIGLCDAVGAAHSLGILHKDIKPSNVLIYETPQGDPKPRLCDFGIGALKDRSQLKRHDVTVTGFTETIVESSSGSRTGTRLYAPPESLIGRPFTVQGDVYALGVMLYQMVVGDLRRPLAQGWEPEVADPLLREDIACAVCRFDERLASARELGDRLRSLESRRDACERQEKARLAGVRRQRIVRLSGAAVVALATVVGVVGFMFVRESGLREAAEQARAAAEFQAYVVSIAAAADALEQDSIALAQRRLARTPVRMRNLEWSYLSNLSDQSLATLRGHESEVVAIAFSPDGSRIASGSTEGVISLWDTSAGRLLASRAGHEGPVYSVAFSPNGKRLATGSSDMTAKLWDAVTGDPLVTLEGHEGVVTSVAFSPDGARLATGSSDMTIRLFDVSTGEEVATLARLADSVDSLAFSPDGSRLASGSDDEVIRILDSTTGAELQALTGHEGYVTALAFASDETLVSASSDMSIRVWDTTSGEPPMVLRGHDDYVTSVTVNHDGTRIASGSEDGTIRVWQPASAEALMTLRGHDGHVHAVAFSPDGMRLASGSQDHTIKIWDSNLQEVFASRGADGSAGGGGGIRAVTFSPDSTRLLMGLDDKTIRVWDAIAGEELAVLRGHDGGVRSVAVSPDGTLIASGSDDRTIRLWDYDTGRAVATLLGHERLVASVAFSPDGTRIASGSWDGSIRVWDVATGTVMYEPLIAEGSVTSIAFSADGAWIASGTTSGAVDLWDASTGTKLASSDEHDGRVHSVAFDPDGTRLASASADMSIKLWDMPTGNAVATLRGHGDAVTTVAFSPDGTRLVSGSSGGMIKLWDAATGHELAALPGEDDSVNCVTFSPDGTRVVSGSVDGTFRVRDALPRTERFDQRVEAHASITAARPVVEGLFERGLDTAQVMTLLQANDSLSEPVLKAALDLALQRGSQ